MSLSVIRRTAAAVATSALVTATVLVPALPVAAALDSVGPVDPLLHFPASYTDSDGVALELCLDGPPRCLASSDELAPAHEQGQDAEAFYFNADAEVGGIVVSNALEAAYADAGPDQEIVFVRTQVSHRAGGLVPGAEYTVTDLYGTLSACVADASGNIRTTACRTELVTGPLDFAGALAGRIGPFLTWDTYGAAVGAPPAGFIGDGTTPHRITGSPTGFNRVRITGPGINASGDQPCASDWTGPAEDCGETDLFVVQGKVQPSQSARLSPTGTLDLGNTADPVTRTVTYTATGASPVAVTSVRLTGDPTFGVSDTCEAAGDLTTGDACTVSVSYTPPASPRRSVATLSLTDSAGSTRSVHLTAATIGIPTQGRTSIAFGPQKVGTTSADEVVSVGNQGAAPLTVGTPVLSGFGGSSFAVDAGSCATPVAPGGACELAVSFQPRSAGTKTADLDIPTDAGTVRTALTGTGTAPAVGLSASSIAFGPTTVGSTSAPRTVTVTNSGTSGLSIEDVVLTGSGATHFVLAGGTCVSGMVLAPTSSCTMRAASAPQAAGPQTAALSLVADGTALDVVMTGEGVATVPGAPGVRPASPGAPGRPVTATARWLPPTSDGGAPVTGYVVQAERLGRAGQVLSTHVSGVLPASSRSLRMSLPTRGSYRFTVRAGNAVGSGAQSGSSNVVRAR